jgi:hypothetical protein
MTDRPDANDSNHGEAFFHLRRQLLGQLAATGALATLWPSLAQAFVEEWEDGDPLCRVPYTELEKPDGYELDAAFLKSFVGLSEALTGVAPVDRHLANQLMKRYATYPRLSVTLKKLIDAYRAIAPGDTPPSADVVKQHFMPDPPLNDDTKELNEGAKQLIYLWYVSAFFLPRFPDPAKPWFDGTPKVWMYDTAEQYRRGLLWSVIEAHAPMTTGGLPGHWADRPAT